MPRRLGTLGAIILLGALVVVRPLPAVAAMRVLGDVQAVLEMIFETAAEDAPHAGALPLAA